MSKIIKGFAHSYGGGGGGFVPTDLGAALKLWFKTPFGGHSGGDPITTWPDSSGNGNDWTFTGGSGSDSAYAANVRNGNDTVHMINGGRVPNTGSTVSFGSGGTMFMVGAEDFDGYAQGYISGGLGMNGRIDYSGTPALHSTVLFDTGAAHLCYSPQFNPTQWHIGSFSFNGADYIKAAVDGGSPTVTTDTGMITFAPTLIGISVGATAITWWGHVGEVIVCAPELSGPDYASVITYLKSRWNIV